jgi:hypothetical protein
MVRTPMLDHPKVEYSTSNACDAAVASPELFKNLSAGRFAAGK